MSPPPQTRDRECGACGIEWSAQKHGGTYCPACGVCWGSPPPEATTAESRGLTPRECEACGHDWNVQKQGSLCPMCGHKNAPEAGDALAETMSDPETYVPAALQDLMHVYFAMLEINHSIFSMVWGHNPNHPAFGPTWALSVQRGCKYFCSKGLLAKESDLLGNDKESPVAATFFVNGRLVAYSQTRRLTVRQMEDGADPYEYRLREDFDARVCRLALQAVLQSVKRLRLLFDSAQDKEPSLDKNSQE